MTERLTRRGFLDEYARASDMTGGQLMHAGRFPVRCSCTEPSCEGWQMAHTDVERLPYVGDAELWRSSCPECGKPFSRKGSGDERAMTRLVRSSIAAHFAASHMGGE